MATIEQLCHDGILESYDGELGPDQFPNRAAYFTKEFCQWLNGDIQELQSSSGVQTSPYEQIFEVFSRMVSGEKLVGEYTKPIPQKKHVWSIHTTDMRIFGWFVQPKLFIACYAGQKKQLIDKSDQTITTTKMINKTVTYRNKLKLRNPKYTTEGVGHVL